MKKAADPLTSPLNKAPIAGFTLMEMLVTLILVSLTTMLMFQMLGSYRIANQRVQAQSGEIDRRALFQDWFRDSVNGLFVAKEIELQGSAAQFDGTTLNPLYASEGAPTKIEWRLEREPSQVVIVYVESGVERWRQPLAGGENARFAYLDSRDKLHDAWPPKFGLLTPGELPAVIMLVREGDQAQPLIAAVLGPLVPPIRVFGFEQNT